MRGSLAEDNPYVSFARGGAQCLAGRRLEIDNTRLKQHKGGEIHAVLLLVHKVYGGELRPWDLRTRIAYKERTQVCGTAEKIMCSVKVNLSLWVTPRMDMEVTLVMPAIEG